LPTGVATDTLGNVYVVDNSNHRIQKFTGTGTYLTQWGSLGHGDGQFNQPFGVTTDVAGNVYVADQNNHRIQKFTGAGTYLSQWGSYGSGDGQFHNPTGVATDASGDVYVADYGNHRIQKFTGSGAYLTQWGSLGNGNGQFNFPAGVTTDAAGNVYVADYDNNRIQKFGPVSTDVPAEASLAFALGPVRPNPSRGGALTVHFTLPTSAPGRLELVDVSGRRVVEREVGSLGSGPHSLDLGTGQHLAPGLYLVRLTQGANAHVARVVVLK